MPIPSIFSYGQVGPPFKFCALYPYSQYATDIRTLYILFILSFVDTTAPTFVKAAFLDQRRDTLTSIFKGVNQDSYAIIRRILEVCWAGIWSDAKIKRTAKINIFNEGLLSQVLQASAFLYEHH